MSSVSTSSTQIVSPIVTQYAPDATIGITTDAQETVTVTGIAETFTYSLANDAAARVFLNAFDLSGLRYDEVNGQVDEDLSSLNLTVKSAINAYITSAVNDATSSNSKTLKTWLGDELRNAFVTAFPGYLSNPDADAPVADAADTAGDGVGQDVSGQSALNPTMPAPGGTGQDAVNANSLASIVRNTIINSFAVDVDVSGAEAAADFVSQFNAAAALLRRSLYRQIAKASWAQYYTAGSPSAGIGAGLPLLAGDKLVFVFDVDVNATTGGTHSGAPMPVSANTILMNLGNRRVAFEFVMPAGEGIIPRT
jgi:hypothetical protein